MIAWGSVGKSKSRRGGFYWGREGINWRSTENYQETAPYKKRTDGYGRGKGGGTGWERKTDGEGRPLGKGGLRVYSEQNSKGRLRKNWSGIFSGFGNAKTRRDRWGTSSHKEKDEWGGGKKA